MLRTTVAATWKYVCAKGEYKRKWELAMYKATIPTMSNIRNALEFCRWLFDDGEKSTAKQHGTTDAKSEYDYGSSTQ